MLAEKGAEHERAWLERFLQEGRDVVSIDAAGGERDWLSDAERTVAAMRRGAEVIYQGVFVDGDWHGISDFLVRVERPSDLGAWSYEAWDTKLARRIEAVLRAPALFLHRATARIQGVAPEGMAIVLGTGEEERLRYRDFDAYYRAVRARFLDASRERRRHVSLSGGALCALRARARCERRWDDDDHLSAGRRHPARAGRATQRRRRPHRGGTGADSTPHRADRHRRDWRSSGLQHQAALQTRHRHGRASLRAAAARRAHGVPLLPQPSRGRHLLRHGGRSVLRAERGLEYLFGADDDRRGRTRTSGPSGRSTARQEKAAFEQFIDFVHERLERWPDLHVYHYAPYEPAALKRLMGEHATREDELDDLLRREVFVDLYQVVRQTLRISHPSYSIKKVRTFFMDRRGTGRSRPTGGDSILEFERWRRTGDAGASSRRSSDYNEEDCRLDRRLRDWLLASERPRPSRPVGVDRAVEAERSRPKMTERARRTMRPTARRRRAACGELGHARGACSLADLLELPPPRGEAGMVGLLRAAEEVARRSDRRHRGDRPPEPGGGCSAGAGQAVRRPHAAISPTGVQARGGSEAQVEDPFRPAAAGDDRVARRGSGGVSA